jgi:hypothetical protein
VVKSRYWKRSRSGSEKGGSPQRSRSKKRSKRSDSKKRLVTIFKIYVLGGTLLLFLFLTHTFRSLRCFRTFYFINFEHHRSLQTSFVIIRAELRYGYLTVAIPSYPSLHLMYLCYRFFIAYILNFYSQQCQLTLFYLPLQRHGCQHFQLFGKYYEILWK